MSVTRRDVLVGGGAFGVGAVLMALIRGGTLGTFDDPDILDDRPTIRVRSGSIVVEIERGNFRRVDGAPKGQQRWRVSGQGPDAFTVRGPGFTRDTVSSGGVLFRKNDESDQIVSFGFDEPGNRPLPYVQLTDEAKEMNVPGKKRLEWADAGWKVAEVSVGDEIVAVDCVGTIEIE